MPHREDHPIAAAERHHFNARLHPRPLFGQDELAASEVTAGLLQQDRDLEREDELAVDVLVQAVEVIRTVLQEERRGPGLPRLVATREERGVIGGEAHVDAECLVPAIGHLGQAWVERLPQLRDDGRQRIGEVAVFAASVAVAGHHHATAEGLISRVKFSQHRALARFEQRWNDGAAAGIELGDEGRPVEGRDACDGSGSATQCGIAHGLRSRLSSSALRFTPQR